ncbi:MAG: hypothetical protein RRC34_00075 [Lentisphaeria bacterium]|nr:hypothetical protein [Lentisphaeria bacterium]
MGSITHLLLRKTRLGLKSKFAFLSLSCILALTVLGAGQNSRKSKASDKDAMRAKIKELGTVGDRDAISKLKKIFTSEPYDAESHRNDHGYFNIRAAVLVSLSEIKTLEANQAICDLGQDYLAKANSRWRPKNYYRSDELSTVSRVLVSVLTLQESEAASRLLEDIVNWPWPAKPAAGDKRIQAASRLLRLTLKRKNQSNPDAACVFLFNKVARTNMPPGFTTNEEIYSHAAINILGKPKEIPLKNVWNFVEKSKQTESDNWMFYFGHIVLKRAVAKGTDWPKKDEAFLAVFHKRVSDFVARVPEAPKKLDKFYDFPMAYLIGLARGDARLAEIIGYSAEQEKQRQVESLAKAAAKWDTMQKDLRKLQLKQLNPTEANVSLFRHSKRVELTPIGRLTRRFLRV